MLIKMLESLLVGASIAAIPGPIFFELVRRTLTKGLKQGVLLVLGEFSGNLLLLLVIFFGASQYLTNDTAKIVFYIIGSLILVWVSSNAFRLKIEDISTSYDESRSDFSGKNESYWMGLIIAITSPIVIALWVSLSSSYLNSLHSHAQAFINIFFIALGFLVFFVPLAYIVHKTRHKIPPNKVVILSRIFGVVLVAYSLTLLYQAVQLA